MYIRHLLDRKSRNCYADSSYAENTYEPGKDIIH